MFANVTIPPRPTQPKPTYPRATVHRVQSGVWATDDGYRIVRQTTEYHLSAAIVNFAVYIPGGLRPKANVEYMREAREVICALRKSGNRCGHPHLV